MLYYNVAHYPSYLI